MPKGYTPSRKVLVQTFTTIREFGRKKNKLSLITTLLYQTRKSGKCALPSSRTCVQYSQMHITLRTVHMYQTITASSVHEASHVCQMYMSCT